MTKIYLGNPANPCLCEVAPSARLMSGRVREQMCADEHKASVSICVDLDDLIFIAQYMNFYADAPEAPAPRVPIVENDLNIIFKNEPMFGALISSDVADEQSFQKFVKPFMTLFLASIKMEMMHLCNKLSIIFNKKISEHMQRKEAQEAQAQEAQAQAQEAQAQEADQLSK
jgi:hypothetical protein